MLAGLLCSLYLILFVLGIGSNLCAFLRTIKVYRWVRKCKWTTIEQSRPISSATRNLSAPTRVNHLIWFTLILSIIDLSLLLCLCFLISDVLAQGWRLGSTLCWYYWWSENIAKTFVAFFICIFSLERYLNSRNETKWKFLTDSSFTVPILIIFGIILVIVLAAPLQPYVGVQTLIIDQPNPITFEETTNLTKCGISEHIPKRSLRYHVMGSFIFAYIIPMIISVFSYLSILRKWKKSATGVVTTEEINTTYQSGRLPSLTSTSSTNVSSVENVQPQSKPITRIGAALSFLYILCWSPYWLTTIMIQFGNVSHASAFTLPFTLFVCHVLPYVNAMLAGLLFMALAKRIKLLKLSDVVSRAAGCAQGEGSQGGLGEDTEGKGYYHEMLTRESVSMANSA